MTAEQFRKEFKTIVYQKGIITNSNTYIRNLHRWDKDGSHSDAIDKAIKEKKELLVKFNELLKGMDYSEWLDISKSLSKFQSGLKSAQKGVAMYETKITNLFKIFL